MNDSEKADVVLQFISITGTSEPRAQFFLDSSRWDLQTALESFYENEHIDISTDSAHVQPNPGVRNQLGRLGSDTSGSSDQEPNDDDVRIVKERISPSKNSKVSGPSEIPSTTGLKKSATPQKSERHFATLSDLSKNNNVSDPSDSDSGNESPAVGRAPKDEQQAFYVGGSEKSGQQVLGPRKPNSNNLIDRLFKEAKAHGAVAGSAPAESKGSGAFSGAGFRLGDSASGSVLVGGTEQSPARQVIIVRVSLYRNGFVIDDGPLRAYDEPDSRLFLGAIMKQQIPHELLLKHRGAEIDLHMENRKTEEYIPRKPIIQPFSGQGYMLGSLVPNVIGAGKLGEKVSIRDSKAVNSEQSGSVTPIQLNESEPVTRVQIRLLNGQRLVGRFNHTHTIADLRNFVMLQPQAAEALSSPFVFASISTVPAEKLNDESLTLEQAGLLNASVAQVKSLQ